MCTGPCCARRSAAACRTSVLLSRTTAGPRCSSNAGSRTRVVLPDRVGATVSRCISGSERNGRRQSVPSDQLSPPAGAGERQSRRAVRRTRLSLRGRLSVGCSASRSRGRAQERGMTHERGSQPGSPMRSRLRQWSMRSQATSSVANDVLARTASSASHTGGGGSTSRCWRSPGTVRGSWWRPPTIQRAIPPTASTNGRTSIWPRAAHHTNAGIAADEYSKSATVTAISVIQTSGA